MAGKVGLLIGTKRGLFVGTSGKNRAGWRLDGPFLAGDPIFCATPDDRDGFTIYAGVNSMHWGPTIARNRGLGKKWEPAEKPPRYHKDSGLAVEAIWQIASDGSSKAGNLYAGVAPAGLFHSTDGGVTWSEVKSLSKHPTRPRWQGGNGGLCLHTILVDPSDAAHIMLGISSVGIFESFDTGATWTVNNQGLALELPSSEKSDGIGSCIHKLAFAAGRPNRIYQQNHRGVHLREKAGGVWKRIEKGLPSTFGFPLVAHPHDPDTAYLIPLQGGEFRAPKNGELAVYATRDAGKSWKGLKRGLPSPVYAGVLRDAFAADSQDPCGLYFGTNSGQVFCSADEGKNWTLAADYLPPVNSVHAFAL